MLHLNLISSFFNRIPGIWFHGGTNKLHVCSGINHNVNDCYDSPELPLNNPSQLVVQQIQDPNTLQYYYSITLDGKEVFKKLNHFPRIFHNVKYYLGDNWYNPAQAWVRKIRVDFYRHRKRMYISFSTDINFVIGFLIYRPLYFKRFITLVDEDFDTFCLKFFIFLGVLKD